MDGIILSDLHIGQKDAADDFRGEKELTRFLRKFRRETVILAGDTFELMECDVVDILLAYPDLIKRILDKATLLGGNHDPDLVKYFPHEFAPRIVANIAGHRTLILHGHQFDWLNSGDRKRVGQYVARAMGYIERHFHGQAERKLMNLWQWICSQRESFDQQAAEMAEKYGCDRVVYGHTHSEGVICIGRVMVANCGDWTRRRPSGFPYVRLTPDAVKVEYFS